MNLYDEYSLYPTDRARAFLERKAAPPDVIHKAASARLSLIGGFNGAGVWEPDPEGKDCLVYPVEYNDEMINIVAWEPNKPARWYLRVPDDTFLGLRALYEARIFNKPLLIVDNPFLWLMGNKAGVCPLTDDALLELIGMTVDCSDAMFARIARARDEAWPMVKRGRGGDRRSPR